MIFFAVLNELMQVFANFYTHIMIKLFKYKTKR